jgi:hypothetical protein
MNTIERFMVSMLVILTVSTAVLAVVNVNDAVKNYAGSVEALELRELPAYPEYEETVHLLFGYNSVNLMYDGMDKNVFLAIVQAKQIPMITYCRKNSDCVSHYVVHYNGYDLEFGYDRHVRKVFLQE